MGVGLGLAIGRPINLGQPRTWTWKAAGAALA